jgi:hypothetical protein
MNNSKNRAAFFKLFFLLLLLVPFMGCGTTRALVDKVTPGSKDLYKRVMVFPFVNDAGLEEGISAEVNRDFLELLQKYSRIRLVEPPESSLVSQRFRSLVKEGVALEPAALEAFQGMGINAIVFGIIQPFEVSTQRTGIWPFRRNKAEYEISLVVGVIDVADTTLMLTNQEKGSKSYDFDDVYGANDAELRLEVAEKYISKMVKAQAQAVGKTLEGERWKGRILAMENGAYKINAGSDVGLQPGHRFEVFTTGETIVAKGGRRLAILGKKVGELRTTSVGEQESLAEPVKEGRFEVGQNVRSRP